MHTNKKIELCDVTRNNILAPCFSITVLLQQPRRQKERIIPTHPSFVRASMPLCPSMICPRQKLMNDSPINYFLQVLVCPREKYILVVFLQTINNINASFNTDPEGLLLCKVCVVIQYSRIFFKFQRESNAKNTDCCIRIRIVFRRHKVSIID